jgi:hypothetical protein
MVSDPAQAAYITNGSSYSENLVLRNGSSENCMMLLKITADEKIAYSLDPILKANVYTSIFNSDANQIWATPQYSCRSGNCTFEPITTIAARAQCHNLTHLLHTRCRASNCTTPLCEGDHNCTVSIGPPGDQGLSLWHYPKTSGYFAIFNTTDFMEEWGYRGPVRLPTIEYIMIEDVKDEIFDYDGVATSDSPISAVAARCEVRIGVQALRDSIENAKHSIEDIGFWEQGEPVMDTTSNKALLAWWHDLTRQWEDSLAMEDDAQAWPPGFMLEPGPDRTFYTLRAFIRHIFGGTFFKNHGSNEYWEAPEDGTIFAYPTIDIIESIYRGNISGCAESDDHLSCGVKNMAKAMTKTFRDNAYAANGPSSANVTYGETQVVIIYVRINWFWLSLPLSVWTMAAVLWMSTVVHTRRMKVSAWANNILPLLFLYRGDVRKEEVGKQGTSNADFLRKTERIAVQLRFSDGKAKLE